MNAEQLQAIKDRVEMATPGPWIIEESRFGNFNAASENESYDLPACLTNGADAQFVTNAREDIPALIAEVERLQRKLNDYSERAETLLEFATTKLGQNSIQIESISIPNLVNSLVLTQNKLDQVELAEVKARMEAEELAKIALDDTYNGFMAKREIERLRAALEFYAKDSTYWYTESPIGKLLMDSDINKDLGAKARKALAGDSDAI